MFTKENQKWNKFVISIDEDCKLKDFLIDEMSFSIRSISRMKREKNIFINGKVSKPTTEVKKGDILEIVLNEDGSQFIPQNLGVRCLYNDEDLLIFDKPPFMVVHPTKSHRESTLANHVSYFIDTLDEKFKIRFVNRLDMNTSGIVIVAKNAYAHHKLSKDMETNDISKNYLAIVEGVIEKDRDTIDLPIYRETEDSITRVVDSRGQRAITHYEVLERYKNHTLVKLKIDTGRTHQIRVHLSSISKGIVGDELYGVVDEDLIGRQALHACKIEFNQPRSCDRILVESELPEDFIQLIDKLKYL